MARTAKKIEEEKIEGIDFGEMNWEFQDVIAQKRYGNISRYVVNLDLYTLGEMYNKKNGMIYYYSSIQRGSKLDKHNNEIPIHRASKVKEIIKAVTEDNWHGGAIILNADADLNKIEYDEELKTLKGQGKFFIIDGNHRLLASRKLTEMYKKGKIVQNPKEYEITCIIDVTDDIGAAKIFSEHADLPLRIPKSRSKFLQVESLENIIARKIMRESEIKGRVETTSNNPKGDNVISFNTLVSGLQKYVKPQTKEQAEALGNIIVKYIDIIVNIYPELLGVVDKTTRDENRKKLLASEPMFIEAYFGAFPELVGKDDMVERLKSLRKVIKIGEWQGEVLSRENPVFTQNIMINNKIVNKKSTAKFVTDTIKEYLTSGKLPIEYTTI